MVDDDDSCDGRGSGFSKEGLADMRRGGADKESTDEHPITTMKT